MLRLKRIVGWGLLVSVAWIASALLHLATPIGHAAVADGLAAMLSSRVRGTAHIAAIGHLGLDLELIDFRVDAPSGERVIGTDRMRAHFDLGQSIRRRAIVLAPCEFEGGEMDLRRGPGDQIDLVHAMEVPDERFMIPIEMRDVRLVHQTMRLELPGIPSIEMANVHGLAAMTIGHVFSCRLDRLRGYINIPIVHVGFDRLGGRLTSDDATPLEVTMVLDLAVADPSMGLRYTAPGAVGGEGDGCVHLQLGADVPDEHHLASSRHVADAR